MINETVDKLARMLAESVPEGLRSVRADLEQNFRSVLNSGLGKMDLVTREEFEVQEVVLARTRSKLQGLEERLESLEQMPVRKRYESEMKKKINALEPIVFTNMEEGLRLAKDQIEAAPGGTDSLSHFRARPSI